MASHHGSKHSLSLALCLNHMVIHSYLINKELYLTFSKYDEKLLVVKSLVNILKYAYWHIKACENRIKVSKISQTQIFIPVIPFLIKKWIKKGIPGMKVWV